MTKKTPSARTSHSDDLQKVPANADAAVVERSFRRPGRVLNLTNAASLAGFRNALSKGERARLFAADSLDELSQHLAFAAKHASSIAQNADENDTNAPDDVDRSGDADVELSFYGRRDGDRARRLRQVEFLRLAAPRPNLLDFADPDLRQRRREIDVLEFTKGY